MKIKYNTRYCVKEPKLAFGLFYFAKNAENNLLFIRKNYYIIYLVVKSG